MRMTALPSRSLPERGSAETGKSATLCTSVSWNESGKQCGWLPFMDQR